MNDNLISGALNEVSDRHIRGGDIELLTGGGKRKPSTRIVSVLFASAAAAALLGLSLTAGAAVTRGFTMKEGYDKFWKRPTVSFSAPGADDSPKTLERLYTPTAFPEGKNYDHSAAVNDSNTVFGASYDSAREEIFDQPFWYDRDIRFWQRTKEAFAETFETPKYVEMSETKVNGCPAYLIAKEHYYGSDVTIIWDNGDYIMELWGIMPADELMRIAESVAVNDNALSEEAGS